MRTLLLFASMWVITTASSQAWTWDTLSGGGGELCPDKTGGYYQWSSNSNTNVHKQLRRLSGNGAVLWEINWNYASGNIRSVACGEDSTVYVSGIFNGTFAIGTHSVQAHNQYRNMFLARLTAGGSPIWIKAITGAYHADYCAIAAGRKNSIVMTGAMGGTVNMFGQTVTSTPGTGYFIARFDSSGNVLDVKTALSGASSGGRICTDTYGNVISTLYAGTASVTIGGVTLTQANAMYLLKMDSALNLIWHTKLPDFNYTRAAWGPETFQPGDAWTARIKTNGSGDIYVLEGAIFQGYSDAVISRYNPAGVRTASFTVWQLPGYPKLSPLFAGQRYLNTFDLDTCGNIYLLGGEYVVNVLTCDAICSNHIMRLSPDLQVIWFKADSADAGNVFYQWLGDISVTGANRCFVTGGMGYSITLKNTLINTGYPLKGFAAMFETLNAPPQLSANNNVPCAGSQVMVSAGATGIVNWFTSQTATVSVASGSVPVTPPLGAGIHTLYAEANSCTLTTGRSAIVLTVQPLPQISIPEGTICQGRSFVFSPSGAVSYTFPGNSLTVSPQATTNYAVTGKGSNGCTSEATTAVHVKPAPSVNILCLNLVCPGYAQTIAGTGAVSYTWSTGVSASSLHVAPGVTTTYTLTGEGENGCYNITMATIQVMACTDIVENATKQLRVYPIPARETIHVEGSATGTIEIYDVSGRLLFSRSHEPDEKIEVGFLPQGCYVIRCGNAGAARFVKD